MKLIQKHRRLKSESSEDRYKHGENVDYQIINLLIWRFNATFYQYIFSLCTYIYLTFTGST